MNESKDLSIDEVFAELLAVTGEPKEYEGEIPEFFKNRGAMTITEYQRLAARTMNNNLTWKEQGKHALHGMVGEIGELHSIYQKKYQGHEFDVTHAKKELGDLMWFIAEYCTSHGWPLEDVCRMNIEKLQARYPEGFAAEKSLNRADGDI